MVCGKTLLNPWLHTCTGNGRSPHASEFRFWMYEIFFFFVRGGGLWVLYADWGREIGIDYVGFLVHSLLRSAHSPAVPLSEAI